MRFNALNSKEKYLRLKYILDSEKAKYTDEGLKAIINASNDDMRYALNNAQNCVIGYEIINEENVYKIIELPKTKEIEKIYDFCFNGNFQGAIAKFGELFDEDYSYLEISSALILLIKDSLRIDDKIRIILIKKISEYKTKAID